MFQFWPRKNALDFKIRLKLEILLFEKCETKGTDQSPKPKHQTFFMFGVELEM